MEWQANAPAIPSADMQAEQAVGLPRKQKIIEFDELGFLGMLLQNMDVQSLTELAKRELRKTIRT